MAVPPAAIIGIFSIGISVGWAYYAARLLAISRRGAFEGSWRNIAIGAIATAAGIAFLTIADFVEEFWIGILGSSLIAVGGVFMFLALISQYSLWRRMLSPEGQKSILDSFATSPVKKGQVPVAPQLASPAIAAAFSDFTKGRKVVFEFDPASSYESYLAGRVGEMLRAGSTVVLFTKQGSTLSGLPGVKLVLLSFSEQSIRLSPEGALSVSITNPSLILEAFSSLIKSSPSARILIDNVTDLIFNLGFDKTYNLLQEMNEIVAGSNSSLILLVNLKAHDERVRGALEGYANAILRFDASGVHSEKGEPLKPESPGP